MNKSTIIVLGLLFAGLTQAAEQSVRVKALTFNTGLLRILNVPVVPYFETREQIVAQEIAGAARLEGWDFIGLQELWEEPTSFKVRYALQREGYKVYFDSRMNWMFGTGMVLAVKAPWRVEAIEHIPFDRRASAELFTLKSFSIAKVVHESGAKMIVAVGHLQAIQVTKNGEPMREFEAAVHRAQADQVLKTALEWQTPGAPEPVLFMGDLNVGPNSASALYDRLITEQGWKALDQGILNTWDANNPLVQASKVANKESAEIDHCLYRDTADVSILEASEKMVFQEAISSLMLGDEKVPLSDHYGLSCSFSVSARR